MPDKPERILTSFMAGAAGGVTPATEAEKEREAKLKVAAAGRAIIAAEAQRLTRTQAVSGMKEAAGKKTGGWAGLVARLQEEGRIPKQQQKKGGDA